MPVARRCRRTSGRSQGRPALQFRPVVALATAATVGAEACVAGSRHMRAPAASLACVLESACVAAASWPVRLAVSVAVACEPMLLGAVGRALERSCLAPERLNLSLAETTLLDDDEDVLLMLAALRDSGIGLVLERFGSGHAGFTSLRRLPLTAIRLDPSLVQGLPHAAEERALAGAILSAGRAFGLGVAADGIETPAQRDFLAAIGVERGLGPLLGRPAPLAELAAG